MHAFVGREDSEEVLSFVGGHRDARGAVLVLDSISIVFKVTLRVTGIIVSVVVGKRSRWFYFKKV